MTWLARRSKCSTWIKLGKNSGSSFFITHSNLLDTHYVTFENILQLIPNSSSNNFSEKLYSSFEFIPYGA
jgi:hypothetical protein